MSRATADPLLYGRKVIEDAHVAAVVAGLHLPGAEHYYQTALSLPLFATTTGDDVVRVAEVLVEACDL